MNCFAILGIEPTEDKEVIKQAYRGKLPFCHPEDNPEEFGVLRKAYEEALVYQTECYEEEPVFTEWMKRIEKVYNDFGRRMDIREWEELLVDDICFSLDTAEQAGTKLLIFLLDHFYLPHIVWKLLEEHFSWEDKTNELTEKFPKRFIDFICANAKYEDDFRYDLFHIEENKPYEKFLQNYYYLLNNFSNDEADDKAQKLQETINFAIEHPDFTILRIRYALQGKDLKLAKELLDELIAAQPEDLKTWYFAALVENENENYKEVMVYGERVLSIYPDHVGVRIILAESFAKQGEYEEALKEYYRAQKAAPYYGYLHNVIHEMNLVLAEQYTKKSQENKEDETLKLKLLRYKVKCGQKEGLNELLDTISMADADAPEYYKLAGEAYSIMNDYERAYKSFERAMEHCEADEELAELYAMSGLSLLDLGIPDMALLKYEEGLELFPNSVRLSYRKAAALTKLHRYQEAIEVCDRILVKESVPNALHFRAEAYYFLEEYQKALEDCNLALSIVPYYVTYIMQLNIYDKLGKTEELLSLAEYMTKIGYANSEVKLYRVRALIELERHKEAKELVNEILTADQKNIEAWYQYSIISWYEGRIEDAYKGIGLSNEQVIDRYGYLHLKAGILCKMEGEEEAIRLYKELIEDAQNKSKEYALSRIAYIYEKRGDYQKAIQYYIECLNICPAYKNINGKIGDLYELLEEYETALKYNKQELQINSDSYLYFQRANLYQMLGDYEKAVKYYEKTIEYNPEDCYAYNSLGIYYMESGELESACNYFYKAIDYKYPDGGPYVKLSTCLRRVKRLKEAESVLDLGLEKYPCENSLLYHKASFYEHIGIYDKAIDWYLEYYYDVKDSMWKNIQIGRCHMKNKSFQLALKCFKAAVRQDKNSHHPYAEIGDLYAEHLNKYKKAIKYYKKAWNLSGSSDYLPYCLANCFIQLGKSKEAQSLYEKAWKQIKRKIDAVQAKPCDYERAGSVCLALKQYDNAVKYYKEAIQRTASYGFCNTLECHEGYYGLGRTYEAIGNLKKAKECYEKAISIENKNKYIDAKNRILMEN